MNMFYIKPKAMLHGYQKKKMNPIQQTGYHCKGYTTHAYISQELTTRAMHTDHNISVRD